MKGRIIGIRERVDEKEKMKPECICLIISGRTGPQIVREFPEILFKRKFKGIPQLALPYGAMEGNFISSTIGKYFFSSYIFLLVTEQEAQTASLAAIFKKDSYDPEKVKEYFKKTIIKFRDKQEADLVTLANSLPDIYRDYRKGKMSMKISTTTFIQIDSELNDKPKPKENIQEKIKKIDDDLWLDDEDEDDESDIESEVEIN